MLHRPCTATPRLWFVEVVYCKSTVGTLAVSEKDNLDVSKCVCEQVPIK